MLSKYKQVYAGVINVIKKENILERGREVYLNHENVQKMIYSNREFADEKS